MKTVLLQGDVSVEVDVKRIVDSALEQLGGLHVIVNLTSDYSATPLKQEPSAEDIAEMVLTLLKSKTITGETIRVDASRHVMSSSS